MRQNKKYWVVIICFLAIMAVFTIFSSTSVSSGLSMLATQNNYLPIIYQQPTPTKTPTPMPSPTPTVTPPIGPIGGTFTSLAVDPNQNDNVYAGHFESGVYKSYDKGQTWYRKSNGLGVLKIQSLASHPTDSNIVYAGTYRGGIYKSMNAAES